MVAANISTLAFQTNHFTVCSSATAAEFIRSCMEGLGFCLFIHMVITLPLQSCQSCLIITSSFNWHYKHSLPWGWSCLHMHYKFTITHMDCS